MTRPTSSGLPYLVRRKDTGKFTYWRTVDANVASEMTGKVVLAWSISHHILSGKPYVKISLRTGDETTARERWGQVHAQIEILLKRAIGKHKEQSAPAVEPKMAATLTFEQRAAIAGQAKHDVLAQHDDNWGDASPLSPIAKGLEQAMYCRRNKIPMDEAFRALLDKFYPENHADKDIPPAARAAEARQIADMLITGSTDGLDRADIILEELISDRNDPSQTQQWALVDKIPGELNRRLHENGIALPENSAERKKVSLAILRAKAAGYKDVEAREAGQSVETPPRPAPIITPKTAADNEDDDPVPCLLEMHALWVKKKRPGQKAIDDNLLYINRFIALHGDMPVNRIKRKHIREYRDMLEQFPRSLPAKIAEKSPAAIIAWANAHPNLPRLTPQTVNAKGIGSVSSLMEIAIAEYDIDGNPCSNLKLTVRQEDQVERLSFHIEDMKRLFLGSPVYRNPPKIMAGGCGAAAFWMPLISQFSGGRLEEIGQLLTSDIKSEGGIHYFDFTTVEDDEALNRQVTPGKRPSISKANPEKRLKSASSQRRVPVHHVLIEIGFLDYVARRQAKRDKRLFPLLKQYRGRWTKNWSRWWARYQDKYVSKEPGKVFHSFRHTFVGAMREAKIWDQFQIALIGHAADTKAGHAGGRQGDQTIDRYGDGYGVKALNDELQKITFANLDLSPLAAVSKLID